MIISIHFPINKNRAHGSVSSRFARGNGSEFLAMVPAVAKRVSSVWILADLPTTATKTSLKTFWEMVTNFLLYPLLLTEHAASELARRKVPLK